MRGHNICFNTELTKIIPNYLKYSLLSKALAVFVPKMVTLKVERFYTIFMDTWGVHENCVESLCFFSLWLYTKHSYLALSGHSTSGISLSGHLWAQMGVTLEGASHVRPQNFHKNSEGFASLVSCILLFWKSLTWLYKYAIKKRRRLI